MANYEKLELIRLFISANYEVDETIAAIKELERELGFEEEPKLSDVPF